jgi:uncharacterized membrane protein YgdD (TMEM256/DUF423 family)
VNSRQSLAAAGLLLALATACGALGAHALRTQLPAERLEVWDTAVRYQFWQSLGLLGTGLALRGDERAALKLAATLMLAGIVLFSGSLYALALGGPRALGAVTPFGGLALIAGWLCFAAGVWNIRGKE